MATSASMGSLCQKRISASHWRLVSCHMFTAQTYLHHITNVVPTEPITNLLQALKLWQLQCSSVAQLNSPLLWRCCCYQSEPNQSQMLRKLHYTKAFTQWSDPDEELSESNLRQHRSLLLWPNVLTELKDVAVNKLAQRSHPSDTWLIWTMWGDQKISAR